MEDNTGKKRSIDELRLERQRLLELLGDVSPTDLWVHMKSGEPYQVTDVSLMLTHPVKGALLVTYRPPDEPGVFFSRTVGDFLSKFCAAAPIPFVPESLCPVD